MEEMKTKRYPSSCILQLLLLLRIAQTTCLFAYRLPQRHVWTTTTILPRRTPLFVSVQQQRRPEREQRRQRPRPSISTSTLCCVCNPPTTAQASAREPPLSSSSSIPSIVEITNNNRTTSSTTLTITNASSSLTSSSSSASSCSTHRRLFCYGNNATVTNDVNNWRDHPQFNRIVEYATWIVPTRHVQSVLTQPLFQPMLATTTVHTDMSATTTSTYNKDHNHYNNHNLGRRKRKLRIVQSHNDTHQLILINQQHYQSSHSSSQSQQRHAVVRDDRHDDDDYDDQCVVPNDEHYSVSDVNVKNDLMNHYQISYGPKYEIRLDVSYFSIDEILQILQIPPLMTMTFDRVGHVVLLKNLQQQHEPYKYVIGNVYLTLLQPHVRTVLQVRHNDNIDDNDDDEWHVLAGCHDFNVTVVEHGLSLTFDLRRVYWNSRLVGERQHLVNDVFHDHQTIVDVFSGVGMLCLLTASKLRHCQVYANDVNPHAIAALNRAASNTNQSIRKRLHTSCQDAYEFLIDMGLEWDDNNMPHHVVMDCPEGDGPSFLNALRWWKVPKGKSKSRRQHSSSSSAVISTVHVYTNVVANPRRHRRRTSSKGNDDGTHRRLVDANADSKNSALQSAIDLVAHNLLPEGNDPTPNRTFHLNKLGCNVKARQVLGKDAAEVSGGGSEHGGNKRVVVCVTFDVTAKLLRHMQGDYV